MLAAVLVRLILWLWFGAAVVVGHLELLGRLPPAALPALVLGLTALALSLALRVPPLRAWVAGLELRTLVLLHLTRFVGVYFLVLHRRGELPGAFAIPAGFGDIFVAAMALPVALAPMAFEHRLRAITIWNVVGLIDILFVVSTAARLNLAAPAQMSAFLHLPLSLLPTFLVPLIIAAHVMVFVRLARIRADAADPGAGTASP
jgi:hypothetical protein